MVGNFRELSLISKGYLKEAYAIIRKHGGLCISDEVQTGFGRTGTNYWGFQNSGVYPDIGKCTNRIID